MCFSCLHIVYCNVVPLLLKFFVRFVTSLDLYGKLKVRSLVYVLIIVEFLYQNLKVFT